MEWDYKVQEREPSSGEGRESFIYAVPAGGRCTVPCAGRLGGRRHGAVAQARSGGAADGANSHGGGGDAVGSSPAMLCISVS